MSLSCSASELLLPSPLKGGTGAAAVLNDFSIGISSELEQAVRVAIAVLDQRAGMTVTFLANDAKITPSVLNQPRDVGQALLLDASVFDAVNEGIDAKACPQDTLLVGVARLNVEADEATCLRRSSETRDRQRRRDERGFDFDERSDGHLCSSPGWLVS